MKTDLVTTELKSLLWQRENNKRELTVRHGDLYTDRRRFVNSILMVTSPKGLGPENDCAGKDQQEL
jgi:hypothetical protein